MTNKKKSATGRVIDPARHESAARGVLLIFSLAVIVMLWLGSQVLLEFLETSKLENSLLSRRVLQELEVTYGLEVEARLRSLGIDVFSSPTEGTTELPNTAAFKDRLQTRLTSHDQENARRLSLLVHQTQSGMVRILTVVGGLLALGILTLAGVIRQLRVDSNELEKRVADRTQELAESEHRHRFILDNALDAVVTLDEEGTILTWNPQAEVVFGWFRDEAVGRELAELIVSHRQQELQRQSLRRFIDGEGGILINERVEIDAIHADGHEFPIELSISPVRVGDTYNFCAFMRNISERRRKEQELREAKENAEAENEARAQVMAHLSHELRTPLHGILSFAGFGIRKFSSAKPEKLRDYFERIRSSGERLLARIDTVFDLVRLESGNLTFSFQPTDIRQVMSAVNAEFEMAMTEKELRLLVETPDEPCMVDVDTSKIKMALRQLYTNAVRVAPDGSRIEVNLVQGSGVMRISIRDFGPGVPEDELETIFNKFMQASNDAREEAAGLGLSLCREILRVHRGRVWAENHPEAGAVFWLEIPCWVAAAKTDADQSDAGTKDEGDPGISEIPDVEEIVMSSQEDVASAENERELTSS